MAAKNLILFYSWSGNTAKMAKMIQEKVGGDLFAVKTVKPYSAKYALCVAQAGKEKLTRSYRELVALPENLADYDCVYVGAPVWYGGWAFPMLSCLKKIDLAGKNLLPFCTHGGGGGASLKGKLEALQPKAKVFNSFITVKDGGANLSKDIDAWLEKVE